ncbi:hypothetical protein KCP73_04895 [Salmonella enterica subsp. enterica]|nr:hypothetical protein KCP73_04895 [Salmonella enterica subsp. enterica]
MAATTGAPAAAALRGRMAAARPFSGRAATACVSAGSGDIVLSHVRPLRFDGAVHLRMWTAMCGRGEDKLLGGRGVTPRNTLGGTQNTHNRCSPHIYAGNGQLCRGRHPGLP